MPKINVVCRPGVKYSLLARGTQAEVNRLKKCFPSAVVMCATTEVAKHQ